MTLWSTIEAFNNLGRNKEKFDRVLHESPKH